ncbi:GNAT family N-acetyltransferase [Kosmotoga pacifica]|uniref:Probable N-acetyltransferase 14 n=1 Tax=Kosmotoga pacifica TaxID=1330330 RepID=A0A0G2Z9A5_9BACT|nr:GNAT family N-acetyltransferase [Kosmotoga pacifica]AKI96656.1 hypothetical protein IX53_01165 [Kosmotoga pacifica]
MILKKVNHKELEDRIVTFEYESNYYYDIEVRKETDGWKISLKLKRFKEPFRKVHMEKLIDYYKKDTLIYVAEVDGKEAGIIQFGGIWDGSVRIWDIYVWKEFKRMGIGTALMRKAEEIASSWGARRLVLETQTSNYVAIKFYESCGFQLCGFDLSSYSNTDVEKHEVRLEMEKKLR